MRKIIGLGLSAGLLIMLVGCSGAGGAVDEPPITEEPQVEATTAGTDAALPQPTQSTATTSGSGACPTATEGTTLYVSEANGYCFLYPTSFTANDQDQVNIDLFLAGQPVEGDTSMEPLIAWMWVNTIAKPGVASDVVLNDYVVRETSKLGALESQVTTEQTTIGGAPAIVARGPLGRGEARVAYVIANNTLYQIHSEPLTVNVPEIQADADLLWNTVTGSMTFFAAPVVDVVEPEEVCPQSQATEQVYVDLAQGYCFLIWNDWQLDTQIPGTWYGGPEIPTLPDFVLPAKHVSISVAYFGPLNGQTLDQMAQQWVEANPDVTSVAETGLTFGGYPAVILDNTTENLGQRTTMIDVNGTMYTILVKPTNAEAYPESQPTANDVWNLVTSTIQFFEPWN